MMNTPAPTLHSRPLAFGSQHGEQPKKLEFIVKSTIVKADAFEAGHADEHVHGPACNHDHPERPGDKYKNPLIRAVVNFVGWFYEFFKSFYQDLVGHPADHDDHHGHTTKKYPGQDSNL